MFAAYIKCKYLSGNMYKCFKGFCRSRRGATGGHREMFVESPWKVSVHFGGDMWAQRGSQQQTFVDKYVGLL